MFSIASIRFAASALVTAVALAACNAASTTPPIRSQPAAAAAGRHPNLTFTVLRATVSDVPLVYGGGYLYGYGGSTGHSVYRIKTTGAAYSELHIVPPYVSTELLYSSGYLYFGLHGNGGAHGYVAVARMNATTGALTVLHNFNLTDGDDPRGGLTLVNGYLYGVTQAAGPGDMGTIFRMLPAGGGFSTFYAFPAPESPPKARLTYVAPLLYGLDPDNTQNGSRGTVFSIGTGSGSTPTILHYFSKWDPLESTCRHASLSIL